MLNVVYLVADLEAAALVHALLLALVIRCASRRFVPFPSHGLPETCSERSRGKPFNPSLCSTVSRERSTALSICLNSFNTVPRWNDAGLSLSEE